eukprot:4059718-Prymnesium_polylepis.2
MAEEEEKTLRASRTNDSRVRAARNAEPCGGGCRGRRGPASVLTPAPSTGHSGLLRRVGLDRWSLGRRWGGLGQGSGQTWLQGHPCGAQEGDAGACRGEPHQHRVEGGARRCVLHGRNQKDHPGR